MSNSVWVGSATFKFNPQQSSGYGSVIQKEGKVQKDDKREDQVSALNLARDRAVEAAGSGYDLDSDFPESHSFTQVDV